MSEFPQRHLDVAFARHVLAVTFLFGTALIGFVMQSTVSIFAGTITCCAYVLAAYRDRHVHRQDLLVFLIVSIFLIPALFNAGHLGFRAIFYFIETLAVFLAAQVISKKPPEAFFISFRCIYYGSLALILVALYVYRDFEEPLGHVIEGSSTNSIPSYLITIQIGYSLAQYVARRSLPFMATLMTFAVAYAGVGRGSLVVAGLIVLGTLVFIIFAQEHSRGLGRRVCLYLMLLLASVLLTFYGSWLYSSLVSGSKLSVGLVDINRLEILEQYLSSLRGLEILTGGDIRDTIITTEYKGNPHIAYIRTHFFFGLPYTLIVIVSPLIFVFSRKSWSSKLLFCSFLGFVILRAVSEPILFPTLLDLFFFTYFFWFFRHLPDRRRTLRDNQSVQGVTK